MLAPIVLDPSDTAPLYLQIATRLRVAVAAGTLTAGARLPSARTLASQLGITRGTVDAAYALLAGEGSIEARGPAGTIISPHMAGLSAPPAQRSMKLGSKRASAASEPLPFRMGLPALDMFPRKLWSAIVTKSARSIGDAHLRHPDPGGYRGLREAIAAYLGISRGITCQPEQILITGGFQGALALVRSALLRPNDAVWVEDPGYLLARRALELAGASLVPVPVDRDGMRVQAGVIAAPRARLAIVTPTHQSPLGVALSLPRRLALLGWAAEVGAWVLEDDYDSEFRYTGHPLPALKSLDRGERVIFAGSFSKVLFPGLRLGYLVAPDALTDAFLRAGTLLNCGQPMLEQHAVAAFMQQGHFARHLRRMRALYAERRQALAGALRSAFGNRLVLELEAGGMHLLARFPDIRDDGAIVRRALLNGLAPTALSTLTMAHDCGQGLLLGFTNVPETDAEAVVRRLAPAVEPQAIT
jgi:GntR family transcriptional regulator/MocR family aminotransferase